MSALYRIENQIVRMKPQELEIHYRDLIHALGVGTDTAERLWADWYYVSRNYHEIVNEKLKSVPWLQNNKNGVIEFVAYIVVGAGLGGGICKVFSKAITKPLENEKGKILVNKLCVGVGSAGGGIFGAYKFTEKVEKLPEFKEWEKTNLQTSIIEFVNQKYYRDEFIDKFLCPIVDRIPQEPVKCFASFYEKKELLAIKDENTGMIQDPKKNGEIHESELEISNVANFYIFKRLEWCVKEDLKEVGEDKKSEESLQKVSEYVKEKVVYYYNKNYEPIDHMRYFDAENPAIDKKGALQNFVAAQMEFFEDFGINPQDELDWKRLVKKKF